MTLLALLSSAALAQSATAFTVLEGPLLTPAQLTWGNKTTIGSPAVVRHNAKTDGSGANVLAVLYETQISGPTANCPAGQWGIGLAYKFAGNVVNDVGAIVVPVAGTYYSCVAAHPTMVASPTAPNTWLVYFKAEQSLSACSTSTPSWGCDRYSGIGALTLSHTGSSGNTIFYNYSGANSTPVVQFVAQNMGYPSVVFDDTLDVYRLAFGQNPDIYMASSPFFSAFPNPASLVLTASGSNHLFSPTQVCGTGVNDHMYVGKRVFATYPTLSDQSLSRYDSANFSTYNLAVGPYFSTLAGNPEMRHVEMVSSGAGSDFAAYFTALGTSGKNELFRTNTALFDRTTIRSKVCP